MIPHRHCSTPTESMRDRWTHSRFATVTFVPTWLVPRCRERGANVVPRVHTLPFLCEPTRTESLQRKGAVHPLIPSSYWPFHVVLASVGGSPPLTSSGCPRSDHEHNMRTLCPYYYCESLRCILDGFLAKFQHRHFNHKDIGHKPILQR